MDKKSYPEPATKPTQNTKKAKEEKLARALRANLARRKTVAPVAASKPKE
jgi:hypothetical protein